MTVSTLELQSLEQNLDSSGMWAGLYKKILDYSGMAMSSNSAVCLSGMNLVADLANADPEVTNGTVYGIGNVVPAWDPQYSPISDLFMAYSIFLGSLDPRKLGGDPNPNLDSQINQAAAQYTAACENFRGVAAKAADQYTKEKNAGMTTAPLPDWLVSNYPVYFDAQKAMLAAQQRHDTLLYQKMGPSYDVLARAHTAVSAAADITMKSAYNMRAKTGS